MCKILEVTFNRRGGGTKMHAPNLNARRAGVLRSFPLSTFSQCFCHKGVQKLFKDDTKVEHSVPVKAQMCNDEVVCCANTKTKGD